jgi:hypothetical protein
MLMEKNGIKHDFPARNLVQLLAKGWVEVKKKAEKDNGNRSNTTKS